MTPELELCRQAEEHLRDAERALIDAKPAETDLRKSIEALQRLAITPRGHRTEEFIEALRRIRRMARALHFQARQGNHLCLGWLQFLAGDGYGANGLPVLPAASTMRSWEV